MAHIERTERAEQITREYESAPKSRRTIPLLAAQYQLHRNTTLKIVKGEINMNTNVKTALTDEERFRVVTETKYRLMNRVEALRAKLNMKLPQANSDDVKW